MKKRAKNWMRLKQTFRVKNRWAIGSSPNLPKSSIAVSD
jgi:hypothetical protein